MRPPQYRDMAHMNEGKPKPPFVGDGPPHMAPRGGPPLPPRPMGPPMMGGREPPRRPAMAQSTYATGDGDEWGAPRPAPRRGGFHGNAAAPAPRAARVSAFTNIHFIQGIYLCFKISYFNLFWTGNICQSFELELN